MKKSIFNGIILGVLSYSISTQLGYRIYDFLYWTITLFIVLGGVYIYNKCSDD